MMELQTTLLLADDDADDAAMFCEALFEIAQNIVCHTAENGKEALDILYSNEKQPPHLIFLDINMPVMGGWECLEKIKSHPSLRNTPVIMYSTVSHKKFVERAISLGALCLFTKPDDFKDLKAILSAIVKNIGGNLLQSIKDFKNINYTAEND